VDTWSLAPNTKPVYTLALPSGAVGLGWDPDAQDFLVGFNGASSGSLPAMKRAGRLLEDRMLVFGKPILRTIKPGELRSKDDSWTHAMSMGTGAVRGWGAWGA
jgi:hypothetical protein